MRARQRAFVFRMAMVQGYRGDGVRRLHVSASPRESTLLRAFAASREIRHDYRPRNPSNTSAKPGWFECAIPERAASMTSGCGWPWSEAMMICLTT